MFTPDQVHRDAREVRLTVVNVGEPDDAQLRVQARQGPRGIGAAIPLLAPGERKTIEFTVQKPGDYPFQCSFHIQLGRSAR